MSDAPKHTRGPWRLNGCEVIGDSRVVATAHWCSGLQAEDDANARLIAAAPELLDALKFVMSAHGEQLHDAFDVAQRAIAKAEGRS